MTIFINPGSAPVAGASETDARANMGTFAADLREAGRSVYFKDDQPAIDGHDGRWAFVITVDGLDYEIEMPGLPVEQVRWLDRPEQNIWDFPRLYVDGSSWVWKYALSVCVSDED